MPCCLGAVCQPSGGLWKHKALEELAAGMSGQGSLSLPFEGAHFLGCYGLPVPGRYRSHGVSLDQQIQPSAQFSRVEWLTPGEGYRDSKPG